MTGKESRLLKVGDRVQWDKSLTDRGTISEVDWRGVTIKWDDGALIQFITTTWRRLNGCRWCINEKRAMLRK